MKDAILDWLVGFPYRPINHSLPPRALLYLLPPLPSRQTLAVCATLLAIVAVRLYCILPVAGADPFLDRTTASGVAASSKEEEKKVRVALFLGSGGHTTELLQLLSALPPHRYTERLYLYSSGDLFSLDKVSAFERRLTHSDAATVETLEIPRARRVHQSFLSTPLSLAYSVVFCIYHIVLCPFWYSIVLKRDERRDRDVRDGWRGEGRCAFSDMVLLNGPGTCVPIVAAIYVLKFLGLSSPKLMYIESFARVKSLSLTAKLLQRFVDRFVVQWPEAGGTIDGRIVYNKWLI